MSKRIEIENIFTVFRLSLDLDPNYELLPNSSYQEVRGWDSLGHMRLIAGLEDEFDIEFEIEEIIDLNTIQKIFELVNSKLC